MLSFSLPRKYFCTKPVDKGQIQSRKVTSGTKYSLEK